MIREFPILKGKGVWACTLVVLFALAFPWIASAASAESNALDVLIWGSDKNEQFAARRELRLQQLPPAPAPPSVSAPTANAIDQFIVAKWEADKLPEAKSAPTVCADATFVRRVYLDLIGVIPSAEESQKFVADTAPGKRAKLVDDLLARNEDYAAQWTPFWEDALASQNSAGGVATHGDYSDFIYKSFVEN